MTNVSSPPKPLGQAGGICNFASGYYTGDGTQGAIVIPIGFTPRYVKLINATDLLEYEYIEGLSTALADTAYPNEDTLLTTGSSGDITLDQNSVIQTNMKFVTATEVAYPASGSQSPDDGTLGTVAVIYEAPVQGDPRLTFLAGSAGAIANVSTKKYVWYAIG